ncbi:alpha-1,3-mannosylglycoprotein 2-beta-N-acetylglucosaminyltransferase [Balamuthia mandrillaris]
MPVLRPARSSSSSLSCAHRSLLWGGVAWLLVCSYYYWTLLNDPTIVWLQEKEGETTAVVGGDWSDSIRSLWQGKTHPERTKEGKDTLAAKDNIKLAKAPPSPRAADPLWWAKEMTAETNMKEKDQTDIEELRGALHQLRNRWKLPSSPSSMARVDEVDAEHLKRWEEEQEAEEEEADTNHLVGQQRGSKRSTMKDSGLLPSTGNELNIMKEKYKQMFLQEHPDLHLSAEEERNAANKDFAAAITQHNAAASTKRGSKKEKMKQQAKLNLLGRAPSEELPLSPFLNNQPQQQENANTKGGEERVEPLYRNSPHHVEEEQQVLKQTKKQKPLIDEEENEERMKSRREAILRAKAEIEMNELEEEVTNNDNNNNNKRRSTITKTGIHSERTGAHVSELGKALAGLSFDDPDPRFNPALVVIAYNRPHYLLRTLESLRSLAGLSLYDVYISQDGDDEQVTQVVQAPSFSAFHHFQRERIPVFAGQPATAYIAQHYRFALDKLFVEKGYSHVVVVEDDMLFSVDFAFYFEQLSSLLDDDPSLWCISSWNDNGFTHLVNDSTQLYRTGYFPGLGWMLKRDTWLMLRDQWPNDHWDNWIRHSGVLEGRECIYPEVSRNYNIGKQGVNLQSDTYIRYFKDTKLNDKHIIFDNLQRLHKDNYVKEMQQMYAQASIVTHPKEALDKGGIYIIPFLIEDFKFLASAFHIWDTPRAYHKHSQLVKFRKNVFLLSDQRKCSYLPDYLRQFPSPQTRFVACEQGESCTECCGRQDLLCFPLDFPFAGNCSFLQLHFPCEGCAMETGDDIPNYVSGVEDKNFGKCLLNEGIPTCEAWHPSTSRLCPCAPLTT